MGIALSRNIFSDTGIKNREQGNLLKEKLINYICKVINEENTPEGFTEENGAAEDYLQPISHP